jgi:maltooligosyltrehalose trehalohydrolase
VACVQNHDQVGNRPLGERLSSLVDFEALKLAITALLISPYVPLLFMGEEYGERAPFLFFTDFGDPDLREAVSRGRCREFADLGWAVDPPDPQDPLTYARSRLDWSLRGRPPHAWLLTYYRTLLELRRSLPVLGTVGRRRMTVHRDGGRVVTVLRRQPGGPTAAGLLNFESEPVRISPPLSTGRWRCLLDSTEARFGGLGPTAPPWLRVSRAGGPEVQLPGHGACIYLRDKATAGVGVADPESVASRIPALSGTDRSGRRGDRA